VVGVGAASKGPRRLRGGAAWLRAWRQAVFRHGRMRQHPCMSARRCPASARTASRRRGAPDSSAGVRQPRCPRTDAVPLAWLWLRRRRSL